MHSGRFCVLREFLAAAVNIPSTGPSDAARTAGCRTGGKKTYKKRVGRGVFFRSVLFSTVFIAKWGKLW